MRPVVFGLVVALAGLVGATGIAVAQQPKGKAGAAAPAAAAPDPGAANAALLARMPAYVESTQIQCTPTDARQIGVFARTEGETRVSTTVIEIACKEGMGYVIGAGDNGKVSADDCASQMGAPGVAPTQLACTLPGNAGSVAALQPLLAKGGAPNCVPVKARGIGKAGGNQFYEVACQGDRGYILSAGRGPDAKFTAVTCLASAGTATKCLFTTDEQNLAPAKALLAKAPKTCTVTNTRYVMTGANGDYFEYACEDKTGFMILANQAGDFVRQVSCADARGVSGGCTLTQADAGQTADNALYTRLAKAAGFNCDVSKYSMFPSSGSGREIVEMACSNRPDGGVGIFPGTGKAEVLNCGRSAVENYRCNLTPPETGYAAVTAQLAALGKSACKVSAIRSIGVTPASAPVQRALIEVACADGDPGWVLAYPKGVNTPAELLTCGQAANQIQGGCTLPTNKKT